ASRHARSALCASDAARPFPAEIGIAHLKAGLTEKDRHARFFVMLATAKFRGDLSRDAIGRLVDVVDRRPKHLKRGFVMWSELLFPVGEVRPRFRLKEGIARGGERARVDKRAPTHPYAMSDGDVPEDAQFEDPRRADRRHPIPALEVGIVLRKVFSREAAPFFDDEDAIALFAEPER